MKIKTIEDAAAFVKKVKICTVFPSEKTEHTSLYEHVDLPEKQPGEKGWGLRVEAVWPWKNELPAQYPNEIFYGKIKGGFAVLMAMDYLADVHFPSAYQSVETLNPLAQKIFDAPKAPAGERRRLAGRARRGRRGAEERCKLRVTLRAELAGGHEAQGRGVNAVAQACRLGAVLEDMAEVRVAVFGADLHPAHAEGHVLEVDDVGVEGARKARPAGS